MTDVEQMNARRVVTQIDHVNIVAAEPERVALGLSEVFGLPFSSPHHRCPTFELGILNAGNVTIEVQRFGGAQDEDPGARLAGIVFEPAGLEASLAELERRAIPHVAPIPFTGDETRLRAYDRFRGADDDPNWRVFFVDGLFGKLELVKRLSARLVVGSSKSAVAVGKIMGRLASHKRLGRMMAPIFAPPARFAGICEWGHDLAGRRTADREALALAQRDGLGLQGVDEVVVRARDAVASQARWQGLFNPVPLSPTGRWEVGSGPALRVVPGDKDELAGLAFGVASLAKARDVLQNRGLFGEESDGGIVIAGERVFGLELRVVAARRN